MKLGKKITPEMVKSFRTIEDFDQEFLALRHEDIDHQRPKFELTRYT